MRKQAEDTVDSELEEETVSIFNLRTSKQREKFLVQSTLTGGWGSSSSRQTPESCYDIHDLRAKELHKGVLKMVILDLQPWSIVNDPGFIFYSYQMNPKYKLASDKFYRGLLNKCYSTSVEKLESKIAQDAPQHVSCQLDGWSVYRHGYVGLLINYITSSWKRVNLYLSCERFDTNHTGENLAAFLDSKL